MDPTGHCEICYPKNTPAHMIAAGPCWCASLPGRPASYEDVSDDEDHRQSTPVTSSASSFSPGMDFQFTFTPTSTPTNESSSAPTNESSSAQATPSTSTIDSAPVNDTADPYRLLEKTVIDAIEDSVTDITPCGQYAVQDGQVTDMLIGGIKRLRAAPIDGPSGCESVRAFDDKGLLFQLRGDRTSAASHAVRAQTAIRRPVVIQSHSRSLPGLAGYRSTSPNPSSADTRVPTCDCYVGQCIKPWLQAANRLGLIRPCDFAYSQLHDGWPVWSPLQGQPRPLWGKNGGRRPEFVGCVEAEQWLVSNHG